MQKPRGDAMRQMVCGVALAIGGLIGLAAPVQAQPAGAAEAEAIAARLAELQAALVRLEQMPGTPHQLWDVAVYAKAAEWITRHQEFYKPTYAGFTLAALDAGLERAAQLAAREAPWEFAPGRSIRAYRSQVDGSLQPYAVSLPGSYDPKAEKRWPLHLVLHGRDGALTEVSFIQTHHKQPPASEEWIQLDVFGRTNNSYRWSGETDVLEALAEVIRRFRIDERRIVLRGFSMGGAGSWHLGLHYPSRWCAVGPGAGFVDFYRFQNVTTALPPYQNAALRIYDAIDYVQNAANVPVCTYGGEQDAQLVASTSMKEAADRLQVPMKLLIGPGVGHKFHPDSFKEYMAFLREREQQGRPGPPGQPQFKFITCTLKYNQCEWATIEELIWPYQPATIEGSWNAEQKRLVLTTSNISALRLSHEISRSEHVREVVLDGTTLTLNAGGTGKETPDSGKVRRQLLLQLEGEQWTLLDEAASAKFQSNAALHKRHNLQGPIDDAFMQPFVCVVGSGEPWSKANAAWAARTLARFEGEFDKWLRGRIPVIHVNDLTPEIIAGKNLILFGDPGSNRLIADLLPGLPVQWTREAITVAGKRYDPETHGLSLIYPNPKNPRRYVVLNAGHTFHEEDFRKSNSWLFPRLGDIAVQKFGPGPEDPDTIVWSDIFDSAWKLSAIPQAQRLGRGGKDASPQP